MTARIGLGVGRTEIRALLLDRGGVAWRAARPVGDDEDMGAAVAELLGRAPARRFGKPSVVAALSPAFSQMKRLSGLPAITDRRLVEQLLDANVGRFFLQNGVPLARPVACRANGFWWGAAAEEPAIAAVERGCVAARLRFEGCVPEAAAIARLVANGSVECRDGPARNTVTVERGNWIEARRSGSGVSPGELIPVLACLGADAGRFADAFAAAHCSRRSPLFFSPPNRSTELRRRAVLRIAAAAAVALSAAGAVAAPGVRAAIQYERDAARFDQLRPAAEQWTPIATELRIAGMALQEIGGFTAGRRSILQLLGRITQTLPDSTAIVTLRVDSAGGSLTLLSKSAATVIPRLASVPGIDDARVSGSVTREEIGGAQLQRIAVRFRFAGARTAPPARGGR